MKLLPSKTNSDCHLLNNRVQASVSLLNSCNQNMDGVMMLLGPCHQQTLNSMERRKVLSPGSPGLISTSSVTLDTLAMDTLRVWQHFVSCKAMANVRDDLYRKNWLTVENKLTSRKLISP